MKAWLRFFRVVNLPTVPGDLLVGAAAVAACAGADSYSAVAFRPFAFVLACAASCCLYLFGLADNDIVGAATDGPERPIPAGEISLGAARILRGLCLAGALVFGSLANLQPAWWVTAFAIALASVLYNRRKWCVLMGLCRGANVLCGGVVLLNHGGRGENWLSRCALLCAAIVWMLYIAAVTKYSEGEADDPVKRQRVGFLIGALVYLQLGALLLAYQLSPSLLTRNFLLAGAGLLVVLRLMKRFLPGVSAS